MAEFGTSSQELLSLRSYRTYDLQALRVTYFKLTQCFINSQSVLAYTPVGAFSSPKDQKGNTLEKR